MNLDEFINPSWKKQFDQLLKPNYLDIIESSSLKAIKEITEPRTLATYTLDSMNNQADLAYMSVQEALSKLAKNSLITPNSKVVDHFKTITTPKTLADKALSGESLFLRKLVLGIPAQASGKNLTRLLCLRRPDSSSSPRPDPTGGRNIGSK